MIVLPTHQHRRTPRLAAAVALAVVLTMLAGTQSAAEASPIRRARPLLAAYKITLERTGGIAGRQDRYVVDRDTANGERPLRLASSVRFRWLRESYQPRNACCDRFSYRLTVFYRHGYSKTVLATDGAAAPRILWEVISLTEQAGGSAEGAPRPA